jgi:hypothetical protein
VIAHRVIRQIERGWSVVYIRDVLLGMIGELFWAVDLCLAWCWIRVALGKRESGGGRVCRRG